MIAPGYSQGARLAVEMASLRGDRRVETFRDVLAELVNLIRGEPLSLVEPRRIRSDEGGHPSGRHLVIPCLNRRKLSPDDPARFRAQGSHDLP
jgi:hypothetical protein